MSPEYEQAAALAREIGNGRDAASARDHAGDLIVFGAAPDAAEIGLVDKTPEEAAAMRGQAAQYDAGTLVGAAEILDREAGK